MKSEKGITLIALIITIIVMLILVGVTINVALNGGIFDKAKDSTQKTSREVSREQIVAAMVGAYDHNGNFVKANAELPEETKWCSKDENYSNASGEGNYIVTKNNEKFYVNPTDGTVMDEEPKGIDNLIPTDVEKLLANNFEDSGSNIYLYTDNIGYVEAGILKMVQIELDSGIYTWLCNDETAVNYDVTGLEAKRWYISNEELSFGSYSGTCPIEFTEEQLQNNSYLQRISDSF